MREGAAEPVAVVSHEFWIRHLGGDLDAVRQPLVIDDREYVVVGVLQRGFRGIDLEPVDVRLVLRPVIVAEGVNGAGDPVDPFTALLEHGITP